MDRWAAVIAMCLVGGIVAMQPAMNAGLSLATGSLPAAFVSFMIGMAAKTVLVAAPGQLGQIGEVEVRWYYILGLEQTPITLERVLGVILLLAGTDLVVK